MSHRRLIATAAALAAGFAFLPSQAFAAGPAQPVVPQAAQTPDLTGIGASAPKTFTSPAEKSYRVQGGVAPHAAVAPRAAAARTIYALTAATCTNDTGTGSQAAPFCNLQHAVDAAASGDTIQVSGTQAGMYPTRSQESVVIKTSGLTIIGGDNPAEVSAWGDLAGKPAITLDGVSDVAISRLTLSSASAPNAVVVKGSTRITLDSNHVSASYGNGIAVDGASGAVKVTRNHIAATYPGSSNKAVTVDAGAKDVTLAANLLVQSGIAATGVQGLNVTNNTVQRGCLPAVAVDGAATAVSIQNNLLVESADAAACDSGAPAVTVSAEAATGTTSDYNDFYSAATNGAGPYSWSGTAYPTLAAFKAASAQGAHDTVETVAPQGNGSGREGGVAYVLQPGSAAIGSANPSAPGLPATDYFGNGPLTDRGAVKYLSTNPTFAMALTAKNTSAFGISLAVDVTTKPLAQDIYINWGDGSTDVLNFYGDKPVQATPAHIYQKLGKYTVTATDYGRDGNTIRNTVQISTVGSQYNAYGPKRLLDTRDGTGGTRGKVPAYGTVKVKVGGNGTIPANVTAVVLNVTVTNPSTPGHITVYGDGDPKPTTSNLNYQTGQTVPNLVTVPVGANGYVDLYNGGWGTVDLIADITGYFTQDAAAGYQPTGPTRLLDSRGGNRPQIGARGSFTVQIAGNPKAWLPNGVSAVALNVTVTNPADAGHLTVYPDGQPLPTASNVNFTAGQTVANAVIVPVGADGLIRLFNGAWSPIDVIVDVVGYYGADARAAFLPVDPERMFDTRDPATWKSGKPLPGRYYIPWYMTSRTDIPAFVFNTTVTNTGDNGHLTVAPDPNTIDAYRNGYATPATPPNVSSLNWRRGDTVPNLVQATPGNGIVDFFNESDGPADLIVDIFGYYQNG